jgi:hypothetical protein
MADSDASIKSYLVVKVLEASGHNSNEVKVWDDDFKEGYVRGEAGQRSVVARGAGRPRACLSQASMPQSLPAVEIRGGARTVRVGLQLPTSRLSRSSPGA